MTPEDRRDEEVRRGASFSAASAIFQAAFWLSLITLPLVHLHAAKALVISFGVAAVVTFATRNWWRRAAQRPSLSPSRFQDPRNDLLAERRAAQKRATGHRHN